MIANPRLLLLLFLPMLMGQNYGAGGAHVGLMKAPPVSGGGGCVEDIATDNFSTGSIGVAWDEAGMDTDVSCPWLISSTLGWDSDHATTCDNDIIVALDATAVGGADQWACFTFVSSGSGPGSPGIVFRGDTSTESTAWYNVWMSEGSSTVHFSLTEGADSNTCVASKTFETGDELCANLSGTGAGTSIDVWVNPAAGDPDDFGAADCTLTANLSNNSGNYIGVRAFSGESTTSSAIDFDDFRGGSCS